MASITLTYTAGGTDYSRTFSVLSLKGMDVPEEWMVRGVQHLYLNGTIEEQILGLSRVVSIDFGVLNSHDDRIYLSNYVKADIKKIVYSTTTLWIANENQNLSSTWEFECELGRRYFLRFVDVNVTKVFDLQQAESDTLLYIKRKVEITGTQASPETLTTNSGKLATQTNGSVYPVFDDTTHTFHVSVNAAPYQEAMVNIVTEVSEVAGNLTFSVAVSDMGKAAADGKTYCDIVIYLEVIP